MVTTEFSSYNSLDGLPSLKYLLSDPFHTKFVNPDLRKPMVTPS